MSRKYTKVLLVTANVGSIFEDPDRMLKMWLKEFLATVKRLDPDFLAIHCQEVGGKNYEESMQHVNQFVKSLLASEEMQQFDKARIFLDEDFTAVDKFTALGNLYFIHQAVTSVQLWDFEALQFVPVEGREVLSGNIEGVTIKEKAKFPQEFFPDFKWSRKGFLRTRWNIYDTMFDLINIHLFHDASNIVAMETTPSVYSENRRRALLHTLDRFDTDEYEKCPYFIFGDFNFRLDSRTLIRKLTQSTMAHQTLGKKNEVSKIVYKDSSNDQVLLTVGKKDFDHLNHSDVFCNNNGHWLLDFDIEPKSYKERLSEYEVTFPPSYPFSEDVDDGASYMKTRCPSYCDRILFTPSTQDILYKDGKDPEYNMMGSNLCMGDHKPIYLNLKLRHGAGNECSPTVGGAETQSEAAQDETEAPTHKACVARHDPNESDHDDEGDFVDENMLSIERARNLKKVISINGEEVSAASMNDINIHDFTVFEREKFISRKFMSTIRRKGGRGQRSNSDVEHSQLEKKSSFKDVAKNVIRVDNVLKAIRHYNHRSDSEPDSEEEDGASSERSSRKRPQRSFSSPTPSSLSSLSLDSGMDSKTDSSDKLVVDLNDKPICAPHHISFNANNNNFGQNKNGSTPHASTDMHVDVVGVACETENGRHGNGRPRSVKRILLTPTGGQDSLCCCVLL